MTSLTQLDLHDNRLSDPIPPQIGTLKRLKPLNSIDLSPNRLSGTFFDASSMDTPATDTTSTTSTAISRKMTARTIIRIQKLLFLKSRFLAYFLKSRQRKEHVRKNEIIILCFNKR